MLFHLHYQYLVRVTKRQSMHFHRYYLIGFFPVSFFVIFYECVFRLLLLFYTFHTDDQTSAFYNKYLHYYRFQKINPRHRFVRKKTLSNPFSIRPPWRIFPRYPIITIDNCTQYLMNSEWIYFIPFVWCINYDKLN